MTTSDIANMIFTAVAGIGGFAIKSIYTAITSLQQEVVQLQINASKTEQIEKDISISRTSISSIGKRVGDLESDIKVAESNHLQTMEILREVRDNERQQSQVFSDLYATISAMQTTMALIKQSLDVIQAQKERN